MNLKSLKRIAAERNWSKQKLKSIRGQLLRMPEAEAKEYLKKLEHKEVNDEKRSMEKQNKESL